MPVIPVLKRQRQEDCELKDSLGYIQHEALSSNPSTSQKNYVHIIRCAIYRLCRPGCLKKNLPKSGMVVYACNPS
jgi:hypothetical protein